MVGTMGEADADILGTSECWALLRTVEVGRLAVLVDGAPDIFPVNFVVDHGSVVFRTAPGTKLEAALQQSPVAFEVDGIDADDRAWSVVLRGVATERGGLDEAFETSALPLFPWHGEAKSRFLRVTPTTVSGRRFPIADRSRWVSAFMGRQ
jgi:hypothetical protein